jgi:hypothetical protein
MLSRRRVLHLIPAAALATAVRGAEGPRFERFDSHIHVHRDAPPIASALKNSKWRALDIVVCPAIGDERFDLEEKLQATLEVARDSAGALAWASTFGEGNGPGHPGRLPAPGSHRSGLARQRGIRLFIS